jgi:hypothetical protein
LNLHTSISFLAIGYIGMGKLEINIDGPNLKDYRSLEYLLMAIMLS